MVNANQIPNEIYEAVARSRNDEGRKYLGMSEAGDPCDRKLWFSFHRFTKKPLDGKTMLIFEFGDHVEQILTRWLRGAGYRLENSYPDKQLDFQDFGGFLRGHCDGIITVDNTRCILECKSAKAKKFSAFAVGGIQKVNPTYYAQAQFYMGYAGLHYAVFAIFNKDTSEIHTELIEFSQAEFDRLKNRVSKIITDRNLPDIQFEQESENCKWCDFKFHCWEPKNAIQTHHFCMSCNYLQIDKSFTPHCSHTSHQVKINDPWLKCYEYAWVGTCPF